MYCGSHSVSVAAIALHTGIQHVGVQHVKERRTRGYSLQGSVVKVFDSPAWASFLVSARAPVVDNLVRDSLGGVCNQGLSTC